MKENRQEHDACDGGLVAHGSSDRIRRSDLLDVGRSLEHVGVAFDSSARGVALPARVAAIGYSYGVLALRLGAVNEKSHLGSKWL